MNGKLAGGIRRGRAFASPALHGQGLRTDLLMAVNGYPTIADVRAAGVQCAP
jgi:hypothetical protein